MHKGHQTFNLWRYVVNIWRQQFITEHHRKFQDSGSVVIHLTIGVGIIIIVFGVNKSLS